MTITELKKMHQERMINMVVTDIVSRGMSELASQALEISMNDKAPALAKEWAECYTHITSSSWDDIRSIIKRSL